MRYVTVFFKFDTHPPLHNANNVEPYIFVTLFSGKSDTLPPPTALRNTRMAPYIVITDPGIHLATTKTAYLLFGQLVVCVKDVPIVEIVKE